MWIYYFNPTITEIMRLLRTTLLLAFTFFILGCPYKECTSPERAYVAEFTIQHKNQYTIGDTIWLNCEMDCLNMNNLITNTIDEFCGKEISSTMFLNQMIDSLKPIAAPALSKFEVVNLIGEVFNDPLVPSADRANQMRFAQVGNFYKIHFGLICKDTGTYILHIHNGGSFGPTHCDRAGFDQVFSNTDRNLDLYLEYIYPNVDSEYGLRNKYVFQVK
jgi:hypothetical protein